MTIIGKRSIANGRKIRWDRQIVNLYWIKIMERIKGCKAISLTMKEGGVLALPHGATCGEYLCLKKKGMKEINNIFH